MDDETETEHVATPYEYPVPFAEFAASIKGTPDEIWTRLLKIRHSDRPRAPSEWHALIDAARKLPAH